MRVISGSLGGRVFDSPKGHRTHPMSEKMRGAIFNMLGDIKGLTVLDGFAGSGALAIEAVSRGAKSVVAVEADQDAFKTIQNNINELGISLDRLQAVRKDVKSWSRNHKETQFDIVLLDPPYDAVSYRLLHQLAIHTKLGGIIVYSLPPDHDFLLDTTHYKSIVNKAYGDATLVVYKRV